MKIKDSTTDRFSMIHCFGDQLKLTVRVIPHSGMPDGVRSALVDSMHRRDGGLERFPNGSFFQHEVGGNKREGMLEEFKIYEDWLESVGVEKGETILQEWTW